MRESTAEFQGNARFERVRPIGAGGAGLVYEVIDREYGTRVALKTLQRVSGDALLRFKNEFRLVQGLRHRNVIRLGELFQEDGRWFFTMELLDGVDFSTFVAHTPRRRRRTARHALPPGLEDGTPEAHAIDRADTPSNAVARDDAPTNVGNESADDDEFIAGPPTCDTEVHVVADGLPGVVAYSPKVQSDSQYRFDEERLRDALFQLVTGLTALHEAGMVHRDIKPHNVMVCDGRVVLLDFGLVSEEQPWHQFDTDTNLLLGTPLYMAPEQAAGHPCTPASDWYAVGTMLYDALCGQLPFEGHPGHVLMEKQHADPLRPSMLSKYAEAIPEDLEDLCMQLLARAETRNRG